MMSHSDAHRGYFVDILGRAIAGNNRGADNDLTFEERYPARYSNPLTDWVRLLIAESKVAHQEREMQAEESADACE
jgi:hypothetical protein